MSKIFNKNRILGFTYGFCMFLLMKPYFMWGQGRYQLLIVSIVSIISLFNLKKLEKSDLLIIPIFAMLILTLSIDSGNNLLGVFFSLTILLFFITDRRKMLIYTECFKIVLVSFLVLSLINYFLVLFTVPLNYNLIEPLNPLKTGMYRQYSFLVFPNLSETNTLPRFCSVFDEPGVIGTFSSIILFSERYNLRKVSNIILFMAGVFSFSLFFTIISFLAILYFYKNKVRLIVVAIVLITFFTTRSNPLVYASVWERFEIENGHLKGDNRSSDELDRYYNQFINSDQFLWGKGNLVFATSSSYKQFIIFYGLINSLIIMSILLCFAIQYNKNVKGVFLSILLLFFLIYQRPYIFDFAYMFLIVYSFIHINRSFDLKRMDLRLNKLRIKMKIKPNSNRQ